MGGQAAFENAVNGGLSRLQLAELEAGALTAAVAALAVLGFAPRIREYL